MVNNIYNYSYITYETYMVNNIYNYLYITYMRPIW